MATTVTFFNTFAPGEKITQEALSSNIGKTIPITNSATGEKGLGTILDVVVQDDGFLVTYETDMNFNIVMTDFHIEKEER